MKTIANKFKQLDQFGDPIELKVKKHTRVYSWQGAISSTIMIFLILFYTTEESIRIFTKNGISYSSQIVEDKNHYDVKFNLTE